MNTTDTIGTTLGYTTSTDIRVTITRDTGPLGPLLYTILYRY